MAADPGLISRRILDEVWNEDDHASLLELVDDRCIIDDLPFGAEGRGPLALLALLNAYKMFVPDLQIRVESQIGEGRSVITSWTAAGHHVGSGLRVPPSRRVIWLQGSLVATVSPRGALNRLHGRWDVADFVRQLGVPMERFSRLLEPTADRVVIRAISRRSGVPVLLFPAMTLPGWITWRRIVRMLEARVPVATFQLLANRRAFEGRPVDESYRLKMETRALRSALDAAGLTGPFDMVGHSAGGTLALDFALDHPDDVRSLTLIEPGATWALRVSGTLTPDLERFLQRRMSYYRGPITTAKFARFIRRTVYDDQHNPTTSPFWRVMKVYRENMTFRPALYSHMDTAARLRAAPFPVMLVQGRDSDDYHRAVAQALRSILPNTRLVRMKGGHVPHAAEGAARLVRHLRRFVRECPARVHRRSA